VSYIGRDVKIGTCELLYYTSYQKYRDAYESGRLGSLEGNGHISDYLKVENGFMFRFPFPDEDRLRFGHFVGSFNRNVPVLLSMPAFERICGDQVSEGLNQIGISMQKPVRRIDDGKFCLALVYVDYKSGHMFRIEDDNVVRLLAKEIVKNHIMKEASAERRSFYRTLASRILKGYRMVQGQDLSVGKRTTDENKNKEKQESLKRNKSRRRL